MSVQIASANAGSLSIPIGIVIGLLASFVQSLGLTIQRKSHVQNQALPLSRQRVEHRRPLWLLGFAIFVSSNILGSLVQIASLPVVILAPLGAVSLLWNALLARFLLGDLFSLWMILGTLLIVGGAVLIGIFGIVPEPTRSIDDLLQLWSRSTFVAYFSLLGVVVFVCLVITHIVEFSYWRKVRAASAVADDDPSPPMSPLALRTPSTVPATDQPSMLTTGVTDQTLTAGVNEHTPLLDRKATSPTTPLRPPPVQTRTRILLAIAFASFSGILSGMCLLFAKSGVELLLLTIRGDNQFWRWEAWMMLIALVAFALLQLWYMHKGLVLADPTLVCPSAFCFYNLSSILNGLVYYDQFSLIPPLHLGLVVLGIVVLLGGVWVVSIQAGGGRVDLGAWHESESSSEASSDTEGDSDVGDLEESITAAESLDDRSRIHARWPSTSPVHRDTRSESHVPTLITTPRPPPRPTTIAAPQSSSGSGSSHGRHASESLLLSPPTVRRRRRTMERSGTLSAHAAPLSPPLGGGFQIGLSPLSPGWAPVPRERRRRVSTLTHSEGGTVARRRRTLSEGDLGLGRHSAEPGEDRGGESGAQNEGGDEEAGKRARHRWGWVKRAFAFRRS